MRFGPANAMNSTTATDASVAMADKPADPGSVLDEVPTEPTVKDKAALKALVGKHALSLQWLQGKDKGAVEVFQDANHVRIRGEHRDPAGDFVTLEGWITEVKAKQFSVRGKLVTRSRLIAKGVECAREGDFTFAIKGGRKFWRLQEMKNPCEGGDVVDYVDVTIAKRR